MTTMGPALREIGSGQVIVLLREKTSDIKSTVVPNNPRKENEGVKVVSAMGEDHIRIRANSFRELGKDSDIWEFRVPELNPETKTEAMVLWYVNGADIFAAMAVSKVI
jgi:hypothetical protein